MTQLQCPSISLDLLKYPDKVVSGKADGSVRPGDLVTILWPGGATYQTTVKEGGRFAFSSAAAWAARPLASGEGIGAYATDAAGNRSAYVSTTVNASRGIRFPAGFCGASGGAEPSVGPSSST